MFRTFEAMLIQGPGAGAGLLRSEPHGLLDSAICPGAVPARVPRGAGCPGVYPGWQGAQGRAHLVYTHIGHGAPYTLPLGPLYTAFGTPDTVLLVNLW